MSPTLLTICFFVQLLVVIVLLVILRNTRNNLNNLWLLHHRTQSTLDNFCKKVERKLKAINKTR